MPVFTADKVQKIFEMLNLPFRFGEEEIAELNAAGVTERGSRMLSFPTPQANSGLNVLNLRQLRGTDPTKQPSFFDHPWYLEEDFGRKECEPGWHTIEMDPDPATIERSYDFNRLLPSAVEVVLMVFLYYVDTGERLLLKKHTWCADEASLGRKVTVGAFGRNGIFISGHPPSFASRGLGICGKT